MKLADEMRQTLLESRRNYSQLLSKTAELVVTHEATLDHVFQPLAILSEQPWTIQRMQKEYQTFAIARTHFRQTYGIKASSWSRLVERVNAIETALVYLEYASRSSKMSAKSPALDAEKMPIIPISRRISDRLSLTKS